MTRTLRLRADRYHRDTWPPIPAVDAIPDWFRDLAPAHRGEDFEPTAKACASLFDGFAAGYLLRLPADVSGPDGAYASSDVSRVVVTAMYPHQTDGAPWPPVFKFETSWHVEIPDGCSVLLCHPLNRPELPFETLAGFLDDGYPARLAPPFVWRGDPAAVVEAGTPIAQLIPFVRADWTLDVEAQAAHKLQRAIQAITGQPHGYRRLVWKRKRYAAGPRSSPRDRVS